MCREATGINVLIHAMLNAVGIIIVLKEKSRGQWGFQSCAQLSFFYFFFIFFFLFYQPPVQPPLSTSSVISIFCVIFQPVGKQNIRLIKAHDRSIFYAADLARVSRFFICGSGKLHFINDKWPMATWNLIIGHCVDEQVIQGIISSYQVAMMIETQLSNATKYIKDG